MTKGRYLFVCSANKQRSKTAEDHFSELYPDDEFESGGTNHKICNALGTNPLEEAQLVWADIVFVMEHKHREIINKHTSGKHIQKIVVLNIKDVYKYNQPELLEILEEKLSRYFK